MLKVLMIFFAFVAINPVFGGFSVIDTGNGFQVFANDLKVIEHDVEGVPCVAVTNVDMGFKERLGNFIISENETIATRNLNFFQIEENTVSRVSVLLSSESFETSGNAEVRLEILDGASVNGVLMTMSFRLTVITRDVELNRVVLRLESDEEEKIYGLGEQYSYLNLKGRNYTIWTREQGVGRNTSDVFTDLVNLFEPGSGGDFDHTYWPQTTYISSEKYLFYLEDFNYANFNFTEDNYTEITVQTSQIQGHFLLQDSILSLVQSVSAMLGRQGPKLPDWAISGAILGVQGGTEKMLQYVEEAEASGVALGGMWIQDWSGKINTNFGTRVFWNWRWNETWYPNLDQEIIRLKQRGIRVTGYINPYLNQAGDIYETADTLGYFLRAENGSTFVQNFGQFYCGTIDFWNPEAYNWYKELIKENLINFGLAGWMADFGEYTPIEAQSSGGEGLSALERHNLLPNLWAKMNKEAVEELGLIDEVVFWSRSGAAGISNYTTLFWAGDQNVDYSYSDGLPSTVTAALSAGMSGMGLMHFDIGGFTTIAQIGLTRGQQLLLRSAEYAVFTPVMRTHEGNQPAQNHQVYSSNDTWTKFARLTQIHKSLFEYTKAIILENSVDGIPVQRPLFLHYEEDPKTFEYEYQYLYGRDLLVAPVLEKDATTKDVYLPNDTWIHLWDPEGAVLQGPGNITVEAPIGYPAVFYRASSTWSSLFAQITANFS